MDHNGYQLDHNGQYQSQYPAADAQFYASAYSPPTAYYQNTGSAPPMRLPVSIHGTQGGGQSTKGGSGASRRGRSRSNSSGNSSGNGGGNSGGNGANGSGRSRGPSRDGPSPTRAVEAANGAHGGLVGVEGGGGADASSGEKASTDGGGGRSTGEGEAAQPSNVKPGEQDLDFNDLFSFPAGGKR